MVRKSFAEISLSSLVSNFRRIRHIVGDKKIIAVVKADAYGHGAVEVARTLEKEGIYAFGVAYISEAIELRDAGIGSPILVFFDNENIDQYFHYNLIPVIFDEHSVAAFKEGSQKHGRPIDVHLKIDTGMGRVGFMHTTCLDTILTINSMKEISVQGIMSHFSDADLEDRSFAEEQLSRFNKVVNEVRQRSVPVIAHIANSAGIMTFPASHLDAVRPGLMMYGYPPFESDEKLSPVMKVKTRIISLRKVPAGTPISYARTFITSRPSLIGVIPIGYADGYNRLFSNHSSVIVNGSKAPVVGRVCMDLTMIDLTDINGVMEGDFVELLSSDPASGLTAQELAVTATTIPYEILTSLGSSAMKHYI